MTVSKTIAAMLGPTLVASGAMLLLNLSAMPAILEEASKGPLLIIFAGYAAFVPGLSIVYFHNRWSSGWPVLITIFGWLSLIVGLVRMLFPMQLASVITWAAPVVSTTLPVVGIVFLLIGGFLSFKGFGPER